MSQLQKTTTNDLNVWECPEKLNEIRALFAPTLNNLEFISFVSLGKQTGLNPFLREIWAIKYSQGKAAQIFIGRDGYRKGAQRSAEYEYHESDVVYSCDQFSRPTDSRELIHVYGKREKTDRIIGAYCIVKRKSALRPAFNWVSFSEYNTGKAEWANRPETMIKKVAEAQGLRASFQDTLGGTYSDAEMEQETTQETQETQQDKWMNKIKAAKGQVIDGEPVPQINLINTQQLTDINNLLTVKEFSQERFLGALKHYGVNQLHDLSSDNAEQLIRVLNKSPNKQ